VAVICCGCFQTFVVRENFFGKGTGKFLAKIYVVIQEGGPMAICAHGGTPQREDWFALSRSSS